MKDNNPFQPNLAEPVNDSDLATDANPDKFTDDVSSDNAKPPRPAVSLDGITPANVNDNFSVDSSPDNQPANDQGASIADPLDGLNLNPPADPANSDETPATGDNASDAAATDGASADPFATLADQADTGKAPKAAKPTKTFTISILTIIFFILTLAGAGGTVYFFLQNDKNSNALADANAKVQQLTSQSNETNTSENKTTDQFTALQDKIADLTKQNSDKQKTLDDNKTKIDDLTKQNTDLTTKVQNISDLTTKLDTLLKNCTTVGGGSCAVAPTAQ